MPYQTKGKKKRPIHENGKGEYCPVCRKLTLKIPIKGTDGFIRAEMKPIRFIPNESSELWLIDKKTKQLQRGILNNDGKDGYFEHFCFR